VLIQRRILGGWKYINRYTGTFFDDEHDVVAAAAELLASAVAPCEWFAATSGLSPRAVGSLRCYDRRCIARHEAGWRITAAGPQGRSSGVKLATSRVTPAIGEQWIQGRSLLCSDQCSRTSRCRKPPWRRRAPLHLCARSQEWWRGIERLKLRAWALGVGEVALVECSVAFAYQALTPAR